MAACEGLLGCLTAAVAALLLLSVGSAAAQTPAPDGPTLAAVRARGHLICAGSDPLPGFAAGRHAQGLVGRL